MAASPLIVGALLASLLAPPRSQPPRMSAQSAAASYSAESITVLSGLEPVRKRPGMYIGSTGTRGLHHLVYEVVDNSIDEALAGHATHVEVHLRPDGSISVTDDGRGIPCDVHAQTGRPALETVLTVLHAGGKFGGSGYKVSAGLHGVGVSVVNALSERMDVAVRRGGLLHSMRFSRGKVEREMEVAPLAAGCEGESGTTVTFTPDGTIFKGVVAFDFDTLAKRFDEQGAPHNGARAHTPSHPHPPARQAGIHACMTGMHARPPHALSRPPASPHARRACAACALCAPPPATRHGRSRLPHAAAGSCVCARSVSERGTQHHADRRASATLDQRQQRAEWRQCG